MACFSPSVNVSATTGLRPAQVPPEGSQVGRSAWYRMNGTLRGPCPMLGSCAYKLKLFSVKPWNGNLLFRKGWFDHITCWWMPSSRSQCRFKSKVMEKRAAIASQSHAHSCESYALWCLRVHVNSCAKHWNVSALSARTTTQPYNSDANNKKEERNLLLDKSVSQSWW